MNGFKIGRLLSGGIITTYSCPSRCAHCLYRCGPQRDKRHIDTRTAESAFETVRKLGCASVHIGGGEPFLDTDTLGEVLEIASRKGVGVEYVETNSAWFRDTESAISVLRRLRKKGLRTLLVSISPFHNAFIPFSKVAGVMDACEKTGIGIFPWVSGFIADVSGFDPKKPHDLNEYLEKYGDDYVSRIPGRYWVHPGGRALETFRPFSDTKPLERVICENPAGCARELTDTSHFHIDLHGNYIPGLCAGLSIGMNDLGRVLARDRYPILNALYHSGVKGLLELAEADFGYRPGIRGYSGKCDVCDDIRTFLSERIEDTFELNPKEFYRQ